MSSHFSDTKVKAEFDRKNLIRESFSKFEGVLRNSKSTLIYTGQKPVDIFMRQGVVDINVSMYEFYNGVKIFRERHDESGISSERVTGFPSCSYEDIPYGHESDFYFLMDGNKVVTNENDAIRLIEKTTGVRLPSLMIMTGNLSMPYSLSEVLSDIDVFPRKEVVVSIESYSVPEKYVGLENYQPSDREMKEGLQKLVERIDSLPKEFGVTNLDHFLHTIKPVRELALKSAETIPVEDTAHKKFSKRIKDE